MDIKEAMSHLSAVSGESKVQSQASAYFENNKDIMAASDFESAMRLGCFDKEFTYYGVAYPDASGRIAYRVSAQSGRIFRFCEQAVCEGLFPTPVVRHTVRRPSPSGYEDAIKVEVKKDCARKIRATYNADYHEALRELAMIPASDASAALLENLRDRLEGLYDARLLQLFEGLVDSALESKVLSLQKGAMFKDWVRDVEHQMEGDIVAKGQHRKFLSGFAFVNEKGEKAFFDDAHEEVVKTERQSKILEGLLCSPIYSKEVWLREMGEFPEARRGFSKELKELWGGTFWESLLAIKATISVVPADKFDECRSRVEANCGNEALEAFDSYRVRWNIG